MQILMNKLIKVYKTQPELCPSENVNIKKKIPEWAAVFMQMWFVLISTTLIFSINRIHDANTTCTSALLALTEKPACTDAPVFYLRATDTRKADGLST